MYALNLIEQDNKNINSTQYLICTDSLSAVQSLQTIDPKNHLQILFHHLLTAGYQITVLWIPGHKLIPGNDLADRAARAVSIAIPQFITCPYTDWFPHIREKIKAKLKNR